MKVSLNIKTLGLTALALLAPAIINGATKGQWSDRVPEKWKLPVTLAQFAAVAALPQLVSHLPQPSDKAQEIASEGIAIFQAAKSTRGQGVGALVSAVAPLVSVAIAHDTATTSPAALQEAVAAASAPQAPVGDTTTLTITNTAATPASPIAPTPGAPV